MYLLLCHLPVLVLETEVLQRELYVVVPLDRECLLLWISLRAALKLEALGAGCATGSLSCICGKHIDTEGAQGSQIEIEDDQRRVTTSLSTAGALGGCVVDSLSRNGH